ncbi:MAG: single-stranded DNA-binding protein [Bacillota bacterium]|jgi:single-strand DNA-binding protein
MYNRIILVGRLTRDPELRFTNNGTPVCQFALAVDSGFGDNKRTDFINIVVWNKQGENCNTYLSKGRLALVEGRLQIRNYENKEGRKVYVTEVVADTVRFLSPKNEQSSAPLGGGFADPGSFDEGFPSTDDDLPF